MSLFRSVTLAFAAVLAATTSAYADRMPLGARVADQQAVSSTYAGKTDLWVDNCNGGIFYAANGQARAWCADSSDSLGAGTWFVDAQGQLCTDLKWYWSSGNRTGSNPPQRNCIAHVQDPLGGLWRSWPTSAEWWQMRRSNTTLVNGYRFQEDVMRTRQKLGL